MLDIVIMYAYAAHKKKVVLTLIRYLNCSFTAVRGIIEEPIFFVNSWNRELVTMTA